MRAGAETRFEFVQAEAVFALQSAGKFDEALVVADAALNESDVAERAALLAAKASVLAAKGDVREALSVATAARESARLTRSPHAMAVAGLALALVLQLLDEHQHAIDIVSECDQIGRECGDELLRQRAKRLLANSYSELGRHEQAIAILKDVIDRQRIAGDVQPRQTNYARMNLLRAESRQIEAVADGSERSQCDMLDLYRRWRAFAEEMRAQSQVRLQAIALTHACRAAARTGDVQFALATLTASLPLQYSVGSRRSCADAEYQHGLMLYKLGQMEGAREALLRAVSLMEGGGPRSLSQAWDALCDVHEAMHAPVQALHALRQARQYERQLRDGEALVAATLVEQRALIERLSDEWSRLAAEDPLTGAANRRAFDRQLATMTDAVNADSRSGAGFALAFFDMDRFKQVNDSAGHGVGDIVLKRFSEILSTGRRGEDMVARLGGDEFAILFGGIRSEYVSGVVTSLVKRVREENWAAIDPSLNLTVSVGAVHTDELKAVDRTPTALLRVADERMYEAKRNGRDQAVTGGPGSASGGSVSRAA